MTFNTFLLVVLSVILIVLNDKQVLPYQLSMYNLPLWLFPLSRLEKGSDSMSTPRSGDDTSVNFALRCLAEGPWVQAENALGRNESKVAEVDIGLRPEVGKKSKLDEVSGEHFCLLLFCKCSTFSFRSNDLLSNSFILT